MKEEYGPVVRQESYYNWPIVSLFARRDIEAILGRASRYPLRPAQELIVHYRQSRSDRYTNVGLVNELVPPYRNFYRCVPWRSYRQQRPLSQRFHAAVYSLL